MIRRRASVCPGFSTASFFSHVQVLARRFRGSLIARVHTRHFCNLFKMGTHPSVWDAAGHETGALCMEVREGQVRARMHGNVARAVVYDCVLMEH